MEACTIFSKQEDLSQVYAHLSKLFGAENLKLEGNAADWQAIEYQRRRLLGKSTLRMTSLKQSEALDQMIHGLMHVFVSVPTDHTAIRVALLARIRGFRSAIGITTKRLSGMEDVVFSVAKGVDGLIFWGGNEMLNAKGQLVLDFKGSCRVAEFDGAKSGKAAAMDLPQIDLDRKARSEAYLKKHDIPFSSSLAPAVRDADVRLRGLVEVADRMLALAVVALKGQGLLNSEQMQGMMETFGIPSALSPEERAFLANREPSEQDGINAIWRYESLWTLMWALSLHDALDYPDQVCDPEQAMTILLEKGGREELHASAKLRPQNEIMDAADLIFRIHWAVVSARLRGEEPPAGIDASITYERHYAFKWLIGYQGLDWDDVRTDT